MKFTNLFSKFKYWLLGILLVVLMTQLSWKTADGKYNSQIISGDGIGYYQYLVNYYHNGTIENQDKNSDFMMEYNGRIVNKCFVGAAVCMAPFYKIAEFHSFIVGESFDPYSPRAKKSINVGSLFYLFLGLAFIFLWLRLLNLKESFIFWSLLGISLGSNLFLYAVLSPSMTHVYSFFTVSAFLFYTANFFSSKKSLSFILAGFFLGLIVVIRPINGVVILLLPLLLQGSKGIIESFGTVTFKTWMIALIVGLLPVIIQFYLWNLQTGDWLVWSYGEEGFYWSKPKVKEALFGFRKGWFVYTPLAALSLFALPKLFKKSRVQFFSLLLFLSTLIYIVSSWWNWFYGSSFGQRSFVDFYALIAFLLATLFDSYYGKRLLNILLKILIVGLIGLNLFQSFQYKENIISSWDMTAKKYVATFGVSEPNQFRIGGSREILPFNAQKELLLDTSLVFDAINQQRIANQTTYFDYSSKEYGVIIKYNLGTCSKLSRGYYLEIETSRLELELNSSENAKLIAEIKDMDGNSSYYSWFLLNEVPAKEKDQWLSYRYQLKIPKCTSDNSELAVYIRNEEKTDFLISAFDAMLFDLY
ncbi:hypothetical protein N8371_06875 [Vicingaceae bacterium]|nr:hypothetical protein [Vicingaceae bacterium]